MAKILIRQIPDEYAESVGLSKYNRSRMPGCVDRFSASVDQYGRFVTGLDEDAPDIPLEQKAKLKEYRLSLEKVTNKKLDAFSPFWETFYVAISSDKPKIFNTEVAMDDVAYRMLIANKYIAPNKEDSESPYYRHAQYYAYTEEGEAREEVKTLKVTDKAISALATIEDNKDKMLIYGQYLEGLKYDENLNPDMLYRMLRSYITSKKENAENFVKALNKSIEELQQKIIVDRAFKANLIVKNPLGNKRYAYQYGSVTLGNTVEEVYRNLSLPEFASELMSLKKLTDKNVTT